MLTINMVKLLLIVFTILIISPQQNVSDAAFIKPSGVITFGKFVYNMISELMEREKGVSDTMLILRQIRGDLDNGIKTIRQSLKNISEITDHVIKTNILERDFRTLDNIFERVVKERRSLIENPNPNRFNDSFYTTPWTQQVNEAQRAFDSIADILTGHNTAFYLAKNFNTNLKQYEDVCKTRISHLQLLDALFSSYQVVAAQYYITINFIYDIVKGPENYQVERVNFHRQVRADYKEDVQRYKNLIATASTDFYVCDPDEHVLDSTYAELGIFSNYLINQDDHPKKEVNCKESDACQNLLGNFECLAGLCKKYRGCPDGNLVQCKQFTDYNQNARACLNKNPSDIARYTSIFMEKEVAGKYHCEDKYDYTIGDRVYTYPGAFSSYTCNYCNCICEEKEFYFSTRMSVSNIFLNKVVTGARFVIRENTLVIQIQEGVLQPNGTIDVGTIAWQEIPEIVFEMRTLITWEDFRKIALNPIKISEDRVLIGLGFDERGSQLQLRTLSQKFDFRTGEVLKDMYSGKDLSPKEIVTAKNELKCNNCDIPTRAQMENKPISTDDQFVQLKTSSLQKDGGQSTIPFIDIQNVTLQIPTPLSGAQLFIRGQEGYGGFLSLKLFTYNITNYIVDDFELPAGFMRALF